MKLLRGTYGNDAVTRTTKGDQISVRLDGQTAVINLDTLVREQNLHFKVDITKNPEKAFNKNLSVRSALIIPMESMNVFYSSSLFLLFTLTCLHKSRILYSYYIPRTTRNALIRSGQGQMLEFSIYFGWPVYLIIHSVDIFLLPHPCQNKAAVFMYYPFYASSGIFNGVLLTPFYRRLIVSCVCYFAEILAPAGSVVRNGLR